MRPAVWALLVATLLALAVLAIALGATSMSVREVWDALGGRGDPASVAIVRALRVPRVVLAALVGAGLGVAGGALQGALRNALAEPYLLGVSGGAAVGAVLAISLGLDGPGVVPLAAFAGATASGVLVIAVARAAGYGSDPRVLLMAGVIVGAFANAAIMVALATAPPDTVRGALWWMMGSVSGADWRQTAWLAAYVVPGAALLVAWGREIDVLMLGDDSAAALGVDVERARRRVFLVSSLIAAATVAAAGLVGFVGLVVPHLARGAGARGHRQTLGAAALAGASLVVAADLAARTARAPAELPLGAVTALLGVPFFLAQIRRLA